ncbi:hypothetical protein P691DRAFT_800837 [Macrolepiota fuliginosa MF-IS2]|uniref:Uncharacterized protein n=1 Tax=Macrolepiota fuliginosa MF-IS2 TaxID=1400762 RepID=A0A9P5XE50_9AGAR|nr:hypothetical protein P691DRAFT_800837 [Macrolepiota fuliginosa MF-IS2]
MYRVYSEGVMFYVYLCVYSVLCVALVVTDENNAFLLVPIFVVIRMVLSTRMVLHTRRLYKIGAPSALYYSSDDPAFVEDIPRRLVAPDDEAGASRVDSGGYC